MKYEVTKVQTDSLTVVFEDKNWAIVPLLEGDTEQDIKDRISTFATKPTFTSVDAVPLKLGYEGETGPANVGYERHKEDDNITYTYKQVRKQFYPSIGDQLDALYWARKGDDTNIKSIDSAIQDVKTKYPKDNTEYKPEDL
mgnify:CR=1 FL=1